MRRASRVWSSHISALRWDVELRVACDAVKPPAGAGEEGREAEMNQAMRILPWYTPLQTPWAGRVRVVGDVDA